MELLQLLPESKKTPDIARDVVHYCHYIEPESLRALPEHLITDELVTAYRIGRSSADLDWPEAFLTDNDYRFAIEYSPMDLERVPVGRKTPALCMYAVRRDGRALKFVPQELVTEEMCLLALCSVDFKNIQSLIPTHCKKGELAQVFQLLSGRGKLVKVAIPERTEAVWRALAISDPKWLQREEFPAELRTSELCMTIVSYDGCALGYVPEELLTEELCLAAVRSDARALPFIPEELRSREICMAAVQGKCSLGDVPEKFRTPELCSLAVERDSFNLEYVPDELKTMELCLKAYELSFWDDGHLPERLRTPEFYSAYVRNWWGTLSEIPQSERTEQMYLDALEHDTDEDMPDEPILTPRLAYAYLRKKGAELHNILYESPFILEALTLMHKRQERIPVKKNVKNPDYWFAIGIIHGSDKVPASIPAGRYELDD